MSSHRGHLRSQYLLFRGSRGGNIDTVYQSTTICGPGTLYGYDLLLLLFSPISCISLLYLLFDPPPTTFLLPFLPPLTTFPPPPTVVVNATRACGYTTTATGPGLVYTAVGYPTYFIVTVRDPYDNVLVHHTPAAVNITVKVEE